MDGPEVAKQLTELYRKLEDCPDDIEPGPIIPYEKVIVEFSSHGKQLHAAVGKDGKFIPVRNWALAVIIYVNGRDLVSLLSDSEGRALDGAYSGNNVTLKESEGTLFRLVRDRILTDFPRGEGPRSGRFPSPRGKSRGKKERCLAEFERQFGSEVKH
jgi:hypothetical protein